MTYAFSPTVIAGSFKGFEMLKFSCRFMGGFFRSWQNTIGTCTFKIPKEDVNSMSAHHRPYEHVPPTFWASIPDRPCVVLVVDSKCWTADQSKINKVRNSLFVLYTVTFQYDRSKIVLIRNRCFSFMCRLIWELDMLFLNYGK